MARRSDTKNAIETRFAEQKALSAEGNFSAKPLNSGVNADESARLAEKVEMRRKSRPDARLPEELPAKNIEEDSGNEDDSNRANEFASASTEIKIRRALSDFEDTFKQNRNKLFEFSNYSYHFKFFMVPMFDYQKFQKTFDAKELRNQIVIAESGVTSAFNINSVEMDNFVGANVKSHNTQMTNIDMEISEPFGMTLFDRLIEAVIQTENFSITETPMFLSLSFVGYGEDGVKLPGKEEFLWPVKLVNISPETGENGTVYSIKLIPMSDVAHNKDTFILKRETVIEDVVNVGEFLDQLTAKMNEQAEEFKPYMKKLKMLPSETNGDFFKINVEKDAVLPGLGKKFSELTFRNGDKYSSSSGRKFTFKLGKGWSISRIIDAMYANLADFAEGVKPGQNPTEIKNYAINVVPRIRCNTFYGKFLPDTQEYGKGIEFIIKPFTLTRIETGDFKTKEKEKIRTSENLKLLKSLDLLKKRYDYVFSGKNIDVLRANVSLNALSAVSLSSSPVILARAVNDDPSRKLPDNLAAAKIEKDQLENLGLSELYAVKDRIDDDEEALRTQSDEENKSRRPVKKSSDSEFSGVNKTAVQEAIDQKTQELSGTVRDPEEIRFSGNRINLESIPRDLSQREIEVKIKPRFEFTDSAPIARYSIQSTQPDLGMERRVTVLEQAYQQGGLVELELEIIGDPFWLGPNAIETKKIRTAERTFGFEHADFSSGENAFFFTYRTPFGIDDETGLARIGESTSIRGIYSVYRVHSKFEEGRFIQTFKAFKNMTIEVT